MVYNVVRERSSFYRLKNGLCVLYLSAGLSCSKFSSMKEVNVEESSTSHDLTSHEESCIFQSLQQNQTANSTVNVKYTPEIEKKDNEVLVADAVNLPYKAGFGDAAISIAVLHHLSTEHRRRKAIEELVRVVKKGGLVLITVWAVEQEDQSLLTKWTPLDKYVEEWIGPGSPRGRVTSPFTLESIPEDEENGPQKHLRPPKHCTSDNDQELAQQTSHSENYVENAKDVQNHQEYFVPWHLPYHRAEISGASASALANGLAKKDDKKGAVVYNRYYHVFSDGELERLVSCVDNAIVIDRFYDKSNWCIILRKTS